MTDRRLACRYRMPPAEWCKLCREGLPEKCIDPGPPRTAGQLHESARPDDAGLSQLISHSLGCIFLGAGAATLWNGHPAWGVLLLAACAACVVGALYESD